MNNFQLQSFLFALLLLIAVTVNGGKRQSVEGSLVSRDIEETSLAMVAQPPKVTKIVIPKKEKASAVVRSESLEKSGPQRLASSGIIGERRTSRLPTLLITEPEPLPSASLGVPFHATAAFAGNIDRGETLYEKDTERRWPIASLVKLMTAVVARENMDLNRPITITEEMLKAEGVSGNFKAGESWRGEDLLTAMLIASSNDAAAALGIAYGNTAFVDEMQKKANEIGMEQTTFFDTTGISYLNQSTIEDLKRFARYLLRNHTDLLALTTKKEIAIMPIAGGERRILLSTHPFAGHPQFLGGKTGYTDEARGNLFSLFTYGNDTLLVVVLGSPARADDTKTLYDFARSR